MFTDVRKKGRHGGEVFRGLGLAVHGGRFAGGFAVCGGEGLPEDEPGVDLASISQ